MRTVLVTGGSRGVGAEVARQLADDRTHVIVHYRAKAKRAKAIASDIRRAGGHASTLGADISDERAASAMVATITEQHGHLDAVVLSASGGMEHDVDPGYAMRLNRDAQLRLALASLPLMSAGGRIVFVTSHQAHFFPHKAVPKGYAPVAASKRAGETALYARRSEFSRAGVHLTVVSGDTHAPALDDFAAAIVNAANTPHPAAISYVGSADYLMTA